MLTLTRRTCTLGAKASTDAKELADGAEVKLLTLEVTLELDAQELNALLCEPHAWDVLYNTGMKPVQPFLKGLKALRFTDPIEHAHVALTFGLNPKCLTFSDCKLSKLELAPQDGGQTELTCKVTATPVLDDTLAQLFEQLGAEAEVEIRADLPGAQSEMPLNSFGIGEPAPKAAKPARAAKRDKHAGLN